MSRHAKQSEVEAVAALLRADPELESWQLRQRGYAQRAIEQARQETAIAHPINSERRMTAALRRKR